VGKLFEELKRRKVFKVAAVYAVVAWLLIQVAATVTPALQLPQWTPALVTVLLILGFIPSLIAAWAYELTPEGVRPDSASHSTSHAPAPQQHKLIYAMFVLLLIAVGFQITDRFLLAPTSSNQNLDAGAIRANLSLRETRVDIVTPATNAPTDFALSPDGHQIVFVANDDSGTSQLWLRSLSTTTAQPLAGTDGATNPFWSPDGRAIGFFAGNALQRIDTAGGAPQTLAPVIAPVGGSWAADNTLLFAPSTIGPLMRVSATGGEATAVTILGPGQTAHRSPYFLPDGQQFLFYSRGTPETSGIYLGHLDGSAPVRLTAADLAGVYHPDGWLLWTRAGTLTAQRLDLAQAALTGESVTLADGLVTDGLSLSALSVSTTGMIAYRTGDGGQVQLTWVDRTGANLGTLGEPDGTQFSPSLSPDGRRVAVVRSVQGNTDTWLLDGARSSRFTFDPALDLLPLWSPDGSQIVFTSNRAGVYDLYQKPSNGAGEETLLLSSDQTKAPNSLSADGRFLLYMSISPQTRTDLWALPMTGEGDPFIVLQTPFAEGWAKFSPDDRWLAYMSNASGRDEIYIRAFVAPEDTDASTGTAISGVWQISTAGGTYPTWSPDGQELYYLDPDANMMAVAFSVTGDSVEVGNPIALFPTRIFGGGTDLSVHWQYDVASDGRFLINTVVGEGSTTPITLIQNWDPQSGQ
jgi:Tol biopolymer transport system component